MAPVLLSLGIRTKGSMVKVGISMMDNINSDAVRFHIFLEGS